MLTPSLPYPPSSGGQVRSYHLIKHLASQHEITLFSLVKDDEEKKYATELEKYCKKVRVFSRPSKPWTLTNILRTGFSLYPFLVIRNFSGGEKKALVQELENEKYDLIHAETFYVMPHLPKTKIPIVLVDITIEFQAYQHYVQSVRNVLLKPLLYLDVLKIKFWELRFWKKASRVVAVSEADKKKMVSFVKGLRVDVVPNGAGEDLMNLWGKREIPKKPVILFQANFSWLQNVEAAQNLATRVFPHIKKKTPDAICRIVGQGAKEKLGELNNEDIQVEDLDSSNQEGVIRAYAEATVFVAPLEGPGGTRLKILAAMASGVPVITTSVGIEGIDAEDGKEVVIADTPEEMAEAVEALVNDEESYRRIALSARRLVEEKYNYEIITKILDQIYREVGHRQN